jgi:hypothetical protein
MPSGNEFLLGFGKIKRKPVCFCNGADDVDNECNGLQENIPSRDESKPRALLARYQFRQAKRVSDHEYANDGKSQTQFVTEHLRGGTHGAHERIFRIGCPATQHDSIDAK